MNNDFRTFEDFRNKRQGHKILKENFDMDDLFNFIDTVEKTLNVPKDRAIEIANNFEEDLEKNDWVGTPDLLRSSLERSGLEPKHIKELMGELGIPEEHI